MTKFLENRKTVRKITKPIVIFYHGDCTDGFTAAWVAWKKFGNRAEYVAYGYEDFIPNLKNKEIYTLDVTFEEPELIQKLIKQNKRLTSIDHHISNKERTLITFKPLYALNHSGCVLAWKYFFPNKKIPKFLLTVEDVDLWSRKVKGGPELYKYLDLFNFDFKIYSKAIRDFEVGNRRNHMLHIGGLILKHEDKFLERYISKHARLVKFAGHKIYAINGIQGMHSQIGHNLCKMQPPFAVIWSQNKSGELQVSLRGDGTIDTSKIAVKYGGGGHKNASAFSLKSLKDIPWKDIK